MKELLRANDRQKNHLSALSQALITARGAQQVLEAHPDSFTTIEIKDPELIIDTAELVNILYGGTRGLYNELVHPLIEKDKGKVKYFRATDKKMKRVVLKIIEEAKMARFERQTV